MKKIEMMSNVGRAKERPPWAAGCGPDWRIVTNGKRYRVEHRTHRSRDSDASKDEWRPVKDWRPPHPAVPLPPGEIRNYYTPFETRFLWRARRRMLREIEEAKPKVEWVEVER